MCYVATYTTGKCVEVNGQLGGLGSCSPLSHGTELHPLTICQPTEMILSLMRQSSSAETDLFLLQHAGNKVRPAMLPGFTAPFYIHVIMEAWLYNDKDFIHKWQIVPEMNLS